MTYITFGISNIHFTKRRGISKPRRTWIARVSGIFRPTFREIGFVGDSDPAANIFVVSSLNFMIEMHIKFIYKKHVK